MNVKLLLFTMTALGSLTAMTACARTQEPAGDAQARVGSAVHATSPTATASADASAAPVTEVPAQTTDSKGLRMVVHKTPSCGCCGLWIDHMRAAGFVVEVRNAEDLGPVKERVGVPYGKGSCHTAEIEGYFIEGHVPAEDVKRLIAEKPQAKGLVLPGMPMGSPGMDSPDGSAQAYTVELVGTDGATTAFAQHPAVP